VYAGLAVAAFLRACRVVPTANLVRDGSTQMLHEFNWPLGDAVEGMSGGCQFLKFQFQPKVAVWHLCYGLRCYPLTAGALNVVSVGHLISKRITLFSIEFLFFF
jgi:hypothetical protein